MSSSKRRPCDGNVGWPVRNEEEDEDEDEEASEEVEEVEEHDEEAAEAAEDDEEGYEDIDSVEENEEEVELTVEVVENESEKDSESQASHPTPSQTQHITHRARGGNLESKRPGTPPSKRQKLEASPTPEESPASAAATATPSTSGSAQGWKDTPRSQVGNTPNASQIGVSPWRLSAWKREDALARQYLSQLRGKPSNTRQMPDRQAL
eukprot:g40355.t1